MTSVTSHLIATAIGAGLASSNRGLLVDLAYNVARVLEAEDKSFNTDAFVQTCKESFDERSHPHQTPTSPFESAEKGQANANHS